MAGGGFTGLRSLRAFFKTLLICGEMSELAEGTRLEIVCAANNGTVGSNPTLSAINFLI